MEAAAHTKQAPLRRDGTASDNSHPHLVLRDIQKSYMAVKALRGVDLEVRQGEVHAIVGENGAGKSTLIAVAAGAIAADAGELYYRGAPVPAPSVSTMRDLGIAVAYQHNSLVPDLTVVENLLLAAPRLADRDGLAKAEELIRQVAGEARTIPLSRRVSDLTLAESHIVEIARALSRDPEIIFFDEPTEPFQEADVERLFGLIRRLKARQVAIVYVSHRLHEVAAIADRISVMRDGKVIDSRPADAITGAEIVTLIAGRPLEQIFPEKSIRNGPIILETRGLYGAGIESVDLAVRAGEIVGVTGIESEGQREFLRCVAGIERRIAGEVILDGTPVKPGAAAARKAGLKFISDDRHAESLFMPLSIRENLGLAAQEQFSRAGIVNHRSEAALATELSQNLRVNAQSIETPVANLSGGNQQKVAIGRALATKPRAIVVDEPTKGVDIGSRSEIYHKLRALADDDVAIVLSSSDGVELEGVCDRVVIFARGRIARELTGPEVTDVSITEANLTAVGSRKQEAATDWRGNRIRGFLSSDHFPALGLVAVITVILAIMGEIQPFFLSQYNVTGVLVFAAVLAFVSFGQLATIVAGGIDLSVGAVAGLTVILASFLMPTDASTWQLIGSAVLILLAGTLVGLVHGCLIAFFGLPAIIVTLASLIALQGLSLILRPTPGGIITYSISDFATYPVFGIPLAILAAGLVAIALEIALFRTGTGRRLRAIGSHVDSSRRIGVNVTAHTLGAFACSATLAALGGLLLAGKIGIGSPGIGIDYTIMSITAVVIGGASIGGGRGSVICTLLGAVLVQLTSSVSSFLNSDSSVHYAVLGSVTLAAAMLFSVVRGRTLIR